MHGGRAALFVCSHMDALTLSILAAVTVVVTSDSPFSVNTPLSPLIFFLSVVCIQHLFSF